MKTAPTFTANVFVGLAEGYSDVIAPIEKVHAVLQRYVDESGFCVTVSETRFIYTGGSEPGVVVGMINYPRFPAEEATLRERAMKIAAILKNELKQFRVSVVFSDETVMLDD